MELPIMLQNMLKAIMETNTVKTWNIYPERNGIVTFKIKFASHDDQPAFQTQSSFKRKSLKQINRDNERARACQLRRQTSNQAETQPTLTIASGNSHPLQPDTPIVNSGMQTRSMTKGLEPEVARTLNPDAETFTMPSPIAVHASQNSDEQSFDRETNLEDSRHSHHSECANTPLPESIETVLDDSLSEYTRDGEYCVYTNCKYGKLGGRSHQLADEVYMCSQCPKWFICQQCFDFDVGQHWHHRENISKVKWKDAHHDMD